MNIDHSFAKSFQDSMTGKTRESIMETTATIAQPTIEVVNTDAPITIDSLVQGMIEAQAPAKFDFSDISDEVYDKAVEAIEDYDLDVTVERALENTIPWGWDWEEVQDFVGNFDPTDYELVTDKALGSFREEIEEAIARVDSSTPDFDAMTIDTVSALEDRIDELESQVESLVEAINNFTV